MVFALFVDGGAHKVGDANPWNLYRILEAQKDTFGCAYINGHLQDVLILVDDFACGYGIFGVAGYHACQCALAVAVGSHDGMYLATVYFQIHTFEYLFVANRGMQIADG